MLRSYKQLKGSAIQAIDGEIGTVDDLYFDDEAWVVRYLVVDTGGWLSGRKVLISPVAIRAIDDTGVHLDLTREKVENGPDIDTDKPVSRQHEARYAGYYGWPAYWTGAGVWSTWAYPGGVGVGGAMATDPNVPEEVAGSTTIAEEEGNPHLRSAGAVRGYYIHATDGDIGHVEDFLFDEDSWELPYFVVDTRNWLPGRKVMVARQWIRQIDWADQHVHVERTREEVKNGPEYNAAEPHAMEYRILPPDRAGG